MNEVYLMIADNYLYPIPQKLIEELKKKYADIDVDEELKRMQVYCKTNPNRRPSAAAVEKFINEWLYNLQMRHSGQYGKHQEQQISRSTRQQVKLNRFNNYKNQQEYEIDLVADEELLLDNGKQKMTIYPVSYCPPVQKENMFGRLGDDFYLRLADSSKYIPRPELVKYLCKKYYPVDVIAELYVMMDYFESIKENEESKWTIEGAVRIWLEQKQKKLLNNKIAP